MRNLIIGMMSVSIVAVYLHTGDEPVSATQIVARPPAVVYAELDTLYSAIERRAATASPVVGTPPYPVKLTFQRDPGRMRGLVATGGLRSAYIKTWVQEGATPAETRLQVAVWPESMLERAAMGDVHSAVLAVLHRTEAQLGTGTKIGALFGEPRHVDTDHASRMTDRPYVSAGSTRPMVDPDPDRR